MESATEVSASRIRRTVWSDIVFLTQVSRPGLWSTTALFYLMPLGHGDFFGSWTFWAGLVYILVPLGLVLYGVNDIVDAEADRARFSLARAARGSSLPRYAGKSSWRRCPLRWCSIGSSVRAFCYGSRH
jgi:4-hydroxybenzoate polyprenyltransferase